MYDSVIFTRFNVELDVDLVMLVIFVAAQVHVLQIVQMTVVATGNVRGGNVSANRDSWV